MESASPPGLAVVFSAFGLRPSAFGFRRRRCPGARASPLAPTARSASCVFAQENDMHELWFDSSGTCLFAVESGRGLPVLLFHGGLATHLACQRFAAPLAARFRLITPDVRGSGRSIHGGDLSWDQLADDVAALVRHLGVGQAVIGGTSFGAGVAVAAALRHPDVVAGLLILNPAYGGAELGFTPTQQAAMDAMDAAG